MNRAAKFLAIALSIPGRLLWADLSVAITAPELQPGMASLETMIQQEAESFTGSILTLIEATVDKPLFMQAFTGAAITASILPGQLFALDGAAFSLGSAASVWSASWSPETLERLKTIGTDDDMESGTNIQPLLIQVSFPLRKLLPGLDAGAYIGFMDAKGSQLGVRSFSAGAFSGLRLFDAESGAQASMVDWQGLRISLGAGYASGTLSMHVLPGPIYQSIPIDPDGAGPLVPIETRISVDPDIIAGIVSSVWTAKLYASTGIELLDALNLSAGIGCSLSAGSSSIRLDADENITIEGYLGSLVTADGRIVIGGSTASQASVLFLPYLSASIGFKVGAFNIVLPFAWNIYKGLGMAVLVELRPWN